MAAEFALILPVLIFMSVGSIGFMMMMSSVSALHFAVEDAARCAAVNKTLCTGAASTQTYAASRYKGPAITGLTFTSTNVACGQKLVGSGTMVFSTGLGSVSTAISATACYPNQS